MFTASLSLAAKDTPRRGKNIRVCLLSRGGEEMKKRMAVPETPVFLHRVPQKTRRVHQEPLYGTARPFRTPGGPLRYRMLHRQKGERPCLRRISQTARKEKAIAKSTARNAAASKKITAKEFAMLPKATQCHSEKPRCPKATQCPQKVDITPLSKSKKPISKTDRLFGSG